MVWLLEQTSCWQDDATASSGDCGANLAQPHLVAGSMGVTVGFHFVKHYLRFGSSHLRCAIFVSAFGHMETFSSRFEKPPSQQLVTTLFCFLVISSCPQIFGLEYLASFTKRFWNVKRSKKNNVDSKTCCCVGIVVLETKCCPRKGGEKSKIYSSWLYADITFMLSECLLEEFL